MLILSLFSFLSLYLSLSFLNSPPKISLHFRNNFRSNFCLACGCRATRSAPGRRAQLCGLLSLLQLPTLFPRPLPTPSIISRRRCYPICCEKEQNYHNFHFLLALLSFSLSPSPNAVALVPRRFPHTRTHTNTHAVGAA